MAENTDHEECRQKVEHLEVRGTARPHQSLGHPGTPVNSSHPGISVQALGFLRYQQDWLGVLITPWFMNLLLLPEPDSTWQTQAPGSKFSRTFPYGVFEFTMANEAQFGVYAVCSLFSPMFQFEGQAAAVAAAKAALQGLLTSPATRAVSRRDLLRGNLGPGKA